jgi:hypothetical protein
MTFETGSIIPVPAAVLDDLGAAADRAARLADHGRELHFEKDPRSGRVLVQERDLATGRVIRTLSPGEAVAWLTGAAGLAGHAGPTRP